MTTELKPVLKWAGGKHKVHDKIFSQFPNVFEDYWEPFLGSAAIALEVYKQTDATLFLSDINEDLMLFYQHLRDLPEPCFLAIEIITDHYNGNDDKRKCYDALRSTFNQSQAIERACLFYFLNKTSFNGLTRYNLSGEFNVPWGERDFRPDYKALEVFSKFLRSSRIKLAGRDYSLIKPQENDVVYFDPPYHPINKTSYFTSFQKTRWGDTQECQLKQAWKKWTKRQVYLLLSNNDILFIRRLFKGSFFHKLDVRKSVGAHSATRKKTPEVIIANFSDKRNTVLWSLLK